MPVDGRENERGPDQVGDDVHAVGKEYHAVVAANVEDHPEEADSDNDDCKDGGEIIVLI